jgi:serine/threonine protein kinase
MEALARFETPHIVAILDQGETPDGNPFFVMEYIEGSELRRAMRSGRMDFARVARLMRQIAQAVSYAHDRHVFHRDLKPENIMLRLAAGDESAVLLDFGIATVKEWQPPTRGAKTAIIGTPAYMAPEQIEGEPSAASDLWALGVIAYEMLTGRQPFPVPYDKQTNAPLLTELYKMQRAGVQLKPIKLRPDLPETAQTAMLRALAFDPQARHAQARDFGEELAGALTGERPHASSSAPTEIIAPGIDERIATLSTIVRAKPESAEVVISFAAQDLGPRAPNRRTSAEGRRRVLDGRSRARSHVGRPLRNHPGDQTVQSRAAAAAPTPRCNRTRSNRTSNWPESHERPYLPLLIERIDFAEQAEYWLEGSRWIEATAEPPDHSSVANAAIFIAIRSPIPRHRTADPDCRTSRPSNSINPIGSQPAKPATDRPLHGSNLAAARRRPPAQRQSGGHSRPGRSARGRAAWLSAGQPRPPGHRIRPR